MQAVGRILPARRRMRRRRVGDVLVAVTLC